MKAFVEGEGITRWRRVRQLLLEVDSRRTVLSKIPFSIEEALGTIDMLKEEMEETKSEGQKRSHPNSFCTILSAGNSSVLSR